MKIIIRYFGPVRELVRKEEESLELREDSTVAELRGELLRRYPATESLVRSCRFAVDMRYAAPDDTIPAGAEVAVIPPVAGG